MNDSKASGTVLFEVPFSYRLEFVPAGKRKPIEHFILDVAKIAVPAASTDEAPVALRWTPGFRDQDWRGSGQIDHRWWDDRLWRPLMETKSRDESCPMTVEHLNKVLAEHYDYSNPFRTGIDGWKVREKLKSLADLPAGGKFVTPHEQDRMEAIAKLERHASALLVVDGIVYAPIPEPVYKLARSGRMFGRGADEDREPFLHAETVPFDSIKPSDEPSDVFRIDRKDDVIAAIAEIEKRVDRHKQLGDGFLPWVEKAIWNPVEVLMPQVLKFGFDIAPRQDSQIDRIVSNMSDRLKDAPIPYMVAYAKLRDLAAVLPRDREAIVALVRDEVIPAIPGDDYTKTTAKELLDEWANRADPASIRDQDLAGVL